MVNGRQPNSLFVATSPITADGMEGDAVASSRGGSGGLGGRSGLDAHVIDATTTRRQPPLRPSRVLPGEYVWVGGQRRWPRLMTRDRPHRGRCYAAPPFGGTWRRRRSGAARCSERDTVFFSSPPHPTPYQPTSPPVLTAHSAAASIELGSRRRRLR